MNPLCLRETAEGVYLSVKVQPRASRNQIGPMLGEDLKISITAPPVDSAANEALIRCLAEQLGCARGAVQLTRGQTSRRKTVFIQGLRARDVTAKLGPG